MDGSCGTVRRGSAAGSDGHVAVRRGRSQWARAFLRYVVPAALVVWAVVDFIITPADRWVNGIALAVAALAGIIALGYERFRGSKTRSGGEAEPTS